MCLQGTKFAVAGAAGWQGALASRGQLGTLAGRGPMMKMCLLVVVVVIVVGVLFCCFVFVLLLRCCCCVVVLLHTERLDHLDHSCGG